MFRMTGRLPVKENDRMCAAQRPISVDPHIGLLIAIFKNKANNCKNGPNLSSQKEKTSKGMSNRVRKSIQSPRLEFAQESLHLRPDFLLPLHGQGIPDDPFHNYKGSGLTETVCSYRSMYSSHC